MNESADKITAETEVPEGSTRFVLVTVPEGLDPETWATMSYQKYNFDYEPWATTATTILAWSALGDEEDETKADLDMIARLKDDGIRARFVIKENKSVWPTAERL